MARNPFLAKGGGRSRHAGRGPRVLPVLLKTPDYRVNETPRQSIQPLPIPPVQRGYFQTYLCSEVPSWRGGECDAVATNSPSPPTSRASTESPSSLPFVSGVDGGSSPGRGGEAARREKPDRLPITGRAPRGARLPSAECGVSKSQQRLCFGLNKVHRQTHTFHSVRESDGESRFPASTLYS